jgi:alcohol dehydrogenase
MIHNTTIIETQSLTTSLSQLLTALNQDLPLDHRSRVLLVSSSGFVKRGLVQTVVDGLQEDFPNLQIDSYCEVTPNPEQAALQDFVNRYAQGTEALPQFIIAIGGGSVLDSAKVLSQWLTESHMDFDDLQKSDNPCIPLIAVPTTSGTGAEVTPFATVWNSRSQKKYSVMGVSPTYAVLNPALTTSLPQEETLYGALDALSHALESLWNNNRNEATEEYALKAIPLILDALPIVLNRSDEQDILRARAKLQQAACLAGQAITTTKTALAHALSYPITLSFGVPHGLACSFTLSAIIKHYGHDDLHLPANLAEEVCALLDSLDLPQYLRQYTQSQSITELIEFNLDPSRAGNFVVPYNDAILVDIVDASQHSLERQI